VSGKISGKVKKACAEGDITKGKGAIKDDGENPRIIGLLRGEGGMS